MGIEATATHAIEALFLKQFPVLLLVLTEILDQFHPSKRSFLSGQFGGELFRVFDPHFPPNPSIPNFWCIIGVDRGIKTFGGIELGPFLRLLIGIRRRWICQRRCHILLTIFFLVTRKPRAHEAP